MSLRLILPNDSQKPPPTHCQLDKECTFFPTTQRLSCMCDWGLRWWLSSPHHCFDRGKPHVTALLYTFTRPVFKWTIVGIGHNFVDSHRLYGRHCNLLSRQTRLWFECTLGHLLLVFSPLTLSHTLPVYTTLIVTILRQMTDDIIKVKQQSADKPENTSMSVKYSVQCWHRHDREQGKGWGCWSRHSSRCVR